MAENDEVYIGKVKFGGDLVSDARPPEHAVFVIAECGSSWRFGDDHLANAYRMIEAAKECGADAVKFQWCSNSLALASRRGEPQYAEAYKFVEYPREWLSLIKGHADKVGIEYMVTAFLPADVAVIAPMVKRFKVAAKEAGSADIQATICDLAGDREIIVSWNLTPPIIAWAGNIALLHCVSKYPCQLGELHLATIRNCPGLTYMGISDHSGHVLTGAVAVGAGATTLEVHCKLDDTPDSNPDAPHSHVPASLQQYIENARLASRMI